ncbi:MAG TPA: efflux RND transporter periplasmic adaptor subunit [Gemmatimonadaceae bacterium]|nr:efflux RND transporter periplasmic adaptor subunit [Gemmatimonadaceae bacterium]
MKRLLPKVAIGVVVVAVVAIVIARMSRPHADGVPQSQRPADTSMAGMAGTPGMNSGGNGAVTLTPAQITQFGITFGTADVRMLKDDIRAIGVVTVDETRLTQVVPRFTGFVERLYVNATGQHVRRGEPLLDVYAPDLVAAQRELLLAQRLDGQIGESPVPGAAGRPGDLMEAAKQRLRQWAISDAQIDTVLRSGQPQRVLTLYAPSNGVVLDRKVVQGQALMAGAELYTIADLSTVWLDVRVREIDAAAVHVGSAADVAMTGLVGHELSGQVAYVYPMLDSVARAVRVRVAVPNLGELLKPGMYATVRLASPVRRALTVPNDAVLRGGDRNIVFVDMGGGKLMPHDVELGRITDTFTEVLAGLEPGQRVVTSAQFLLDSESNLGEVMKSMMSQMNAGDMSKNAGTVDMPGMSGMPAKGAAPSKAPPAKR